MNLLQVLFIKFLKQFVNMEEVQLLLHKIFQNIKILSQYTNLSEKEKIEIKSLKRGESLMFVGEDHILAKVEVSEEEKELLI